MVSNNKEYIKITLIVGQRGVGKTDFLRRVEEYYVNRNLSVQVFDLDAEIEKRHNKKVFEIFTNNGEEKFRQIENQTLKEVFKVLGLEFDATDTVRSALVYDYMKSKNVFIALGAGYSGPLPQSANIIWLRRNTDEQGRVFLDRPRLIKNISAFEEFIKLSDARKSKYRQISHEVLWTQEGQNTPNEFEELFLGLKSKDVGGCFTLLPAFLSSQNQTQNFIQKRLSWEVDAIELRNDILSLEQVQWAAELIPADKILLSLRERVSSSIDLKVFENLDVSIDEENTLEVSSELFAAAKILSLHGDDKTSVCGLINKFAQWGGGEAKEKHLKLAPLIENWEDLKSGHNWWLQDPNHRSFLPRSTDGRWAWYRLLQKGKMSLNFWREDEGSCLDQPLLVEWLSFDESLEKGFAAIIGSPVAHSLTPAEQGAYFRENGLNVLSIKLEKLELFQLKFLQSLGLKAAAITAPLKKSTFEICEEVTERAQKVMAVNTLVTNDNKVWGDNTDLCGLNDLLENVEKNKSIAVWGGGGTLEVIRKLLPLAKVFSARTGLPRDENLNFEDSAQFLPRLVIWGVGRSRMFNCEYPPEQWRPQIVIDLNYSEDSPGREYALKCSAKYISGLKMFLGQAMEQRRVWARQL